MSDSRINRMYQRVSSAFWRERCAELEQKQAHTADVAVAALRKVEKLQAQCDELQRKLDRASSYDEDVVIPEMARLQAKCEALEKALLFYAKNSPHSDTAKADNGETARTALGGGE